MTGLTFSDVLVILSTGMVGLLLVRVIGRITRALFRAAENRRARHPVSCPEIREG